MKKIPNVPMERVRRPASQAYGFVGDVFVPPHIMREVARWSGPCYGIVERGPKGLRVRALTTAPHQWAIDHEDVRTWRQVLETGTYEDKHVALRAIWAPGDPRAAQHPGREGLWAWSQAHSAGWPWITMAGLITCPATVWPGTELPSDEEIASAKEQLIRLERQRQQPRPPITLEWVAEWLRAHDPETEAMGDVQWRWEGHLDYALLHDARKAGLDADAGLPPGWEELAADWSRRYDAAALRAAVTQAASGEAARHIGQYLLPEE